MARNTKRLSWITLALAALTTVVAAQSHPGLLQLPDFEVTVEMSATAGAGVATTWQGP